jgi:hypothetical protein
MTISASSVPLQTGTVTLTGLTQSTVTYTTVNYSAGLKWKPIPGHGKASSLIVYGNVLFQLNNVGLRADPSPSGGISWSFFAPLK